MRMKLHAKDDGLWLELKADGSKKELLTRIGPETNTPQQKETTFTDVVCHEVWAELRLQKRREAITELEDEEIRKQLVGLSHQFEHETKWLLLEAAQRI